MDQSDKDTLMILPNILNGLRIQKSVLKVLWKEVAIKFFLNLELPFKNLKQVLCKLCKLILNFNLS